MLAPIALYCGRMPSPRPFSIPLQALLLLLRSTVEAVAGVTPRYDTRRDAARQRRGYGPGVVMGYCGANTSPVSATQRVLTRGISLLRHHHPCCCGFCPGETRAAGTLRDGLRRTSLLPGTGHSWPSTLGVLHLSPRGACDPTGLFGAMQLAASQGCVSHGVSPAQTHI